MAKPKSSTFLDDVKSRIVHTSGRALTWFDKLSPDAQAECLAVREAFRRGELGLKERVARALVSAAEERGWRVAKTKRVAIWLSAEH